MRKARMYLSCVARVKVWRAAGCQNAAASPPPLNGTLMAPKHRAVGTVRLWRRSIGVSCVEIVIRALLIYIVHSSVDIRYTAQPFQPRSASVQERHWTALVR